MCGVGSVGGAAAGVWRGGGGGAAAAAANAVGGAWRAGRPRTASLGSGLPASQASEQGHLIVAAQQSRHVFQALKGADVQVCP